MLFLLYLENVTVKCHENCQLGKNCYHNNIFDLFRFVENNLLNSY